jgi:hypothetical protein
MKKQAIKSGLNIRGYMHVAIMGNWEEVVKEQYCRLIDSGLYQLTEQITVTVVGDFSLFNTGILPDEKFVILDGGPLNSYEFPSLEIMKSDASLYDGLAWYIHTKGVKYKEFGMHFHQGKRLPYEGMIDWRKYMEYFAIDRYDLCMKALQYYDCCGVDYKKYPYPHFSGNFWWARMSHLRRLTSLQALREKEGFFNHCPELSLTDRHRAEFWLFQHPQTSYKCLHHSRNNFYLQRFPEERYKERRQSPFFKALLSLGQKIKRPV